jgi:hypothetical protein
VVLDGEVEDPIGAEGPRFGGGEVRAEFNHCVVVVLGEQGTEVISKFREPCVDDARTGFCGREWGVGRLSWRY